MLHYFSLKDSSEYNEDRKTSTVFENLMLLPDNVFWHILRQSCCHNEDMPTLSGQLQFHQFWPSWSSEDTTNELYVQPDVFMEFKEFDLIIEAKRDDDAGQYRGQWENEIIAYCNEHRNTRSKHKKPLVFIAVGGNQWLYPEPITAKGESFIVHKCTWLSLLMSVTKYREEIGSISVPDMAHSATCRLLDHIIQGFELHGVSHIKWFDSIARKEPLISASSITTLKNTFTL